MTSLKKSLTLTSGTALFLNIVIGAGLLVLPGLAYQQVGNLSIISWLVCALVAIPSVMIFMILGKQFPDAGGVPHYALRAFGKMSQRIASFIFLGAVIFGQPAIALTGGYYLDKIFPISPHFYAAVFVIAVTALHSVAGPALGKILITIGSSLLVVLLALMAVAFIGIDYGNLKTALPSLSEFHFADVTLIFAPLMMIFFAYTGWEVGTHAAEDFINSDRDFPRAMIYSFVIATFLYFILAGLVQMAGMTSGFDAPFVELTRPVLGEGGKFLVAIVTTIIIFANIFGAMLAVSRMVFALGREQLLPPYFAVTRGGVPMRALIWLCVIFMVILGLDYGKYFVNIQQMLALCGQNLLIMSGIAAACLWRITPVLSHKILAGLGVAITLVILLVAGVAIYYPIGLALLAIIYHYRAAKQQS